MVLLDCEGLVSLLVKSAGETDVCSTLSLEMARVFVYKGIQ
jgi:hypothetical protein